ncbi:adenylate isopentenyltransferase [Artemisia annua]|uniref:Adenylate isopentenyltransferase n=1 Tax=Artemisia annua TaxID=35608 RepID=A0A2U1Q9Y0_ARTAN|nr:adenylate isopentenyltransferase [Artemisia annua]
MGATGAGKSRLSVDLVTRYFHNAEIINSDKMQVYNGLNHTTNKITLQEQMGVPHHLLGAVDPTRPVFTPSDFRRVGLDIIKKVKGRRKIPIIVGGSNSFIYSLLVNRFDPEKDVFNGPDPDPVCSELQFDVCFIWVDVCLPVLNNYLSRRVDEMLECGMFDELSGFFRSGEYKRVNASGLGQAIGVPEFEGYFSKFKDDDVEKKYDDDVEKKILYEDAVRRIKENTCQLAKRQIGKILRLRDEPK